MSANTDTPAAMSHELFKWLVGLVLVLTSTTFGYTLRTESRLTMLETSYAAHLLNVTALTQNNERRLTAIEAVQAENARLTNDKLDKIADNVALIQGAMHLKTAN